MQPGFAESCDELSRALTRTCTNAICEERILDADFPFSSCNSENVDGAPVNAFAGDIFNDSVGHQARFRWIGNTPGTEVAIAYGSDYSQINNWQGNLSAELTAGEIIREYAHCTGQGLNEDGLVAGGEEYTTTLTTGAITGNGRCGIDLSSSQTKGGALAPWEKRYFKLGFIGEDEIQLGKTYAVANVPSGMVFVDEELWPDVWYPKTDFPICDDPTSMPGITGCRFSFAIDKYEFSNPNPVVYAGPQYPNSYSDPLFSVRGASPFIGNTTWGGFKQGCLNRSYEPELASYVDINDLAIGDKGTLATPSPLRKVQLVTSISWLVASYTSHQLTPGDSLCSRPAATNTGALENCVSDFGAMDMFGNYWDMVDEIIERNVDELQYLKGTAIASERAAPASLTVDGGLYNRYTTNFDFALVVPTEIRATPKTSTVLFFDSDWFYYDTDGVDDAVRRAETSMTLHMVKESQILDPLRSVMLQTNTWAEKHLAAAHSSLRDWNQSI